MLRVATEAEKKARDALAWTAWGSGLSVEQFCAREARLRAHPWTSEVMTTWLWDDLQGAVLGSCESFRLPSRVAGAWGQSWSIASVFVEPHLRRRGYASQMIHALVRKLSKEPGAQAAVLFSEVGAAIYERAGFLAVPASDVCFAPLPRAAAVEWLSEPPVPPDPPDAPQTLVIPARGVEVDWHLERERYYAAALGRPALRHHGARVKGSTIAWTAYHRTSELHVLWLEANDPEHRAALISAAQHTAFEAHLERVRLWETLPLGDLPGASRTARHDALPMFAPFVPSLTAWSGIHRALWV